MRKYSKEFKLEVIKYCLEKCNSVYDACRKFNIPSATPIKRWIKRYEHYGIEGLTPRKISYDGKFKQNVVEYMRDNHLSLEEASAKFGINNPTTLSKWERIYYEEGPQALYEERRGKKKIMSSKQEKKKLSKKTEEDLIAENQRLRMENEYLKKLNALVQERIKRENKKK